MKIKISFTDTWTSSFHKEGLTRDHHGEWSSGERGASYTGSGKNGFNNYTRKDITMNTVKGILYRLIGCRRRLCDIKKDEYFKEDLISFSVHKEETASITTLKNTNYEKATNYRVPQKKDTHPFFSEPLYSQIWAPIFITDKKRILSLFKAGKGYSTGKIPYLNKVELYESGQLFKELKYKKDPLNEEIKDLKVVSLANKVKKKIGSVLTKDFTKVTYQSLRILLICQNIDKAMSLDPSIKSIKRGFSVGGVDYRYFFEEHIPISNPSVWEGWVDNGDLKKIPEKRMLIKIDGTLEINLDVSHKESLKIKEDIINSGVHTFYVGKKGMAYIKDIEV